ncbi:hypothetical protein ACFFLS_24465 [Flavobacterium procerum]|uniref:C1q domain-containing protein n=1 Tax=Flavobacterium procerum TaxID=1455569 RepID=A0ABV6BXM9_9FLAO
MKKITLLLLVIQSGIMMAQKTILAPTGQKITIHSNVNNGLTATDGVIQLGGALVKPTTINTSATNTLAIKNLTTSTDTSDTPIVVEADGTLKKGAFPPIDIVPTDMGTVIVVDGKLQVAQELTVKLREDYPIGSTNYSNRVVGKLTAVTDTDNTFITSDTSNSFTVTTTGWYMVSINTMFYNSSGAAGGSPAIGVWCNTDNVWVARNNNALSDVNMNTTLITTITMSAGKTYSFRASCGFPSGALRAEFTYYSIKRL